LVDVIKEINKQIDSLAFNVSLEPETLGEFESGFANVSDEVRKLSKRASQAAVKIEQSLTTVQYLLQNELKFNLQKESVQQMSNTGKIVESVRTLQESRDYMRQYYKTLFSLVTTHNTRVTKEIAEILGQIQFQDVARQRIERMENAMAKRNVLFQAFARELDAPDANLLELPVQMREVLDEYMSIESCHAPASNNTSGQDADLFKHELF
jgi:methyl-accepting chemotaxis protein